MPLKRESAKIRTAIWAVSFLSMGFILPPKLCVDTALADGVGHTIDGQHISGDAVVDAVGFRVTDHVFERRLHDAIQLLVDHGLFPEVSLAILHPLEIRGGDASCVGEDVGNNEDAFFAEHVIGGGGGGTVGALGENAALEAIDVSAGDYVLGGSGNQDLAFSGEQFGSIVFLRAGETVHGAVLLAKIYQGFQID